MSGENRTRTVGQLNETVVSVSSTVGAVRWVGGGGGDAGFITRNRCRVERG